MMIKTFLIRATGNLILAFIFAGMIFIGCSSDDDAQPVEPQITRIAIFPDSANIPVGDHLEFSAIALTADGDTVDNSGFDIEWEWWSTDPDVFTVQNDGTATGVNPGEAYCVIEATVSNDLNVQASEPTARIARGNKLSASFTGRDSAFVFIF